MEKFTIGWGLSGGFGNMQNYEVVEAANLEDAALEAWERACEEYDSYVGTNELRSIGEIMDEECVDEIEAIEIYIEDRESWIDCSAIPYEDNHDETYSGYHFYNPFKK